MRKIPVIHRRATSSVEDCHGEAAWWGHYTPSKCKRRFVLLFCLFISIIFFIGDFEFDGEEWGFLLVFGGWDEEWMGLLGLHRSVFFFFLENPWVSVFSILGFFSWWAYLLQFYLFIYFHILVQNFFWTFFIYVFEGVPDFDFDWGCS